MIAWLIPLLISMAVNVVAYLIAPKPKSPKPEAAKQSEAPTADAGKPYMIVFGTITVKELNCLWYGEQSLQQFKVNA